MAWNCIKLFVANLTHKRCFSFLLLGLEALLVTGQGITPSSFNNSSNKESPRMPATSMSPLTNGVDVVEGQELQCPLCQWE